MTGVEIRRELRPGDYGAIIQHHGRTYAREFGVDESFEAMVAASVTRAAMGGWPRGERDGIWIVERDGQFGGSLALTDEDADSGALRWFVLDRELRGHGLGRRLVSELVAQARAVGFDRLRLETFSELRAAAHLYRSHGFEVVREETGPRWGRDSISYQYYELELAAAKSAVAAAHSVA